MKLNPQPREQYAEKRRMNNIFIKVRTTVAHTTQYKSWLHPNKTRSLSRLGKVATLNPNLTP